MLNLERLMKRPKTFHSLTGLSPEEFRKLAKEVKPLWEEAEIRRKSRKDRKRKIGAGRKYKLSFEQSLFLLLLYYRTYVNHVFIGMIGDVSDSKIHQYFARLEPALQRVFRIPKRKIDLSKSEILELIVDATEQESERRPGSGYSGKKKRQTVKTQIITSEQGHILSVSKTVSGNRHDKRLYDETKAILPKDIPKLADLGYLGTSWELPHKSSKHHPLTEKQREDNKKHAKRRIVVEHVFAHMKQFRILGNRYRNPIRRYNLTFKNIAGLRNFVLA
jgi:hypothetical protein